MNPKVDASTRVELIRKFDAKEIKTWSALALELGVEPPDIDKGQSTQKVQQYSVRLKVRNAPSYPTRRFSITLIWAGGLRLAQKDCPSVCFLFQFHSNPPVIVQSFRHLLLFPHFGPFQCTCTTWNPRSFVPGCILYFLVRKSAPTLPGEFIANIRFGDRRDENQHDQKMKINISIFHEYSFPFITSSLHHSYICLFPLCPNEC